MPLKTPASVSLLTWTIRRMEQNSKGRSSRRWEWNRLATIVRDGTEGLGVRTHPNEFGESGVLRHQRLEHLLRALFRRAERRVRIHRHTDMSTFVGQLKTVGFLVDREKRLSRT